MLDAACTSSTLRQSRSPIVTVTGRPQSTLVSSVLLASDTMDSIPRDTRGSSGTRVTACVHPVRLSGSAEPTRLAACGSLEQIVESVDTGRIIVEAILLTATWTAVVAFRRGGTAGAATQIRRALSGGTLTLRRV